MDPARPPPPPLVIGVIGLLAGALFVSIGLFRPSFLWSTPKVAQGIKSVGEGTVRAVFVLFGLLMAGLLLNVARRMGQQARRRPSD